MLRVNFSEVSFNSPNHIPLIRPSLPIVFSSNMDEAIDFADIPNQIRRNVLSTEFKFNLMLVGITGVGKSTLVKSLFEIKPEETVGEAKLNEYSELLEENGVKLMLRCIETSNFDSHKSDIYTEYIDDKFKAFFAAQVTEAKWSIEDERVHCCLYMIPPYGKMRLKEEDIKCMKALHEKVNLVPIIARADTFNETQLSKFKENILADLMMNGINYYKFHFDEKEDEDRFRIVKQESERFPFAVVAADEPTLVDGKYRWIRETLSGHIDIGNKSYDFDALAKLLIRHCMYNLVENTHLKHYAKFRADLLQQCKKLDNDEDSGKLIGLETPLVYYLRNRLQNSSWHKLQEERAKKLQSMKGVPVKRNEPPVPKKPEFLKNLRC